MVNWDFGVEGSHEQVTQALRQAKRSFDLGFYKDTEKDLTKAFLLLNQLESSIKYLRDDVRKYIRRNF